MYNSIVVDISAFLENLYLAFKLSLKAKGKDTVIEELESKTSDCDERLKVLTSSGFANEIIPVLKCDAYGLGAIELSNACKCVGVETVAVVRMKEAMALKDSRLEILILNAVYRDELEEAIKNKFCLTVYSEDQINDIENVASCLRENVNIHLKINTGMNRFGADEEFIPGLLEKIQSSENIKLTSVLSHYHNANSNNFYYTYKQYRCFKKILSIFDQSIKVHLSNSAGLINYPQFVYGSSRPGIMLYGCYPDYEMFVKYKGLLKPVVEIKSVVLQVRKVKKNEYIGYGDKWKVDKDTFMALIPFGYGDGYPRNISLKNTVLINGKVYRLFGNISMDSFSIIFDNEGEVCVGDCASIIGGCNENALSVDEAASEIGIISYELLTGLNKRVNRAYINTP